MEKKTFRQRVSKVVRGIYTNYLKYVKKVTDKGNLPKTTS